MSRHYSEDDLTLYYYGEGRRRRQIEQHLDSCASCAAAYRDIADTLTMITPAPVPDRGEQYGLEVWQRVRHQLPDVTFRGFTRFTGFSAFATWPILAAAAAGLVVVAFVAGEHLRLSTPAPASTSPGRVNAANPLNQDDSRRVLLASVADHLDRSERILTDVMNAPASSDISPEQQWAEDLIATSRLYRQDAVDAGEVSVAAVLDDLERSLIEIVHSPSRISAADLDQIRRRIDAAALLFKVRILSDELRRRDTAPSDAARPRPSTRKIG